MQELQLVKVHASDDAPEASMIDYRKILIAYIDHVDSCEGTDFLGYEDGPYGLSKVEICELNKLADELHAARSPVCSPHVVSQTPGIYEVTRQTDYISAAILASMKLLPPLLLVFLVVRRCFG